MCIFFLGAPLKYSAVEVWRIPHTKYNNKERHKKNNEWLVKCLLTKTYQTYQTILLLDHCKVKNLSFNVVIEISSDESDCNFITENKRAGGKQREEPEHMQNVHHNSAIMIPHFQEIRYIQSWATKVMKQWDEALNASSLQFLCQR
jgi:hypothetical protein